MLKLRSLKFVTSTVFLVFTMCVLALTSHADVVVWQGPTNTMTIGLSDTDVAHIEFPEEIINVTVENPDYVDILLVDGYGNRAFRMRSLLPQMATRTFFTGASGNTYIAVLTTDVPYRSFVQITDGTQVEEIARSITKNFDATDLIRAMAKETDVPGVLRETYLIPNWFNGAGLTFELTEVWQSPQLTGLVVNVKNLAAGENEVNLAAIAIPETDEWGILRQAAMENMRLAPTGRPGDQGLLFLVFGR
jgi:hypothetical protein